MDTTLTQPKAANRLQRILMVDDDDIFLGSTRRYLRRAGYQLLIAHKSNEAIELATRQPVGVIVPDVLMPSKDGLDTIRQAHKRLPNLKIIVMSGGDFYNAEILTDLDMKFGACKALEKPFPKEELLAMIKELFEEYAIKKN